MPNFYIDDLVVTVTDGHNLVGNPNFEAGYRRRMEHERYGGTATLGVSTTNATPERTAFRRQSAVGLRNTGIRYALPIGAANYAITFYAMQQGTKQHPLQLQAAYTCLNHASTSHGNDRPDAQPLGRLGTPGRSWQQARRLPAARRPGFEVPD